MTVASPAAPHLGALFPSTHPPTELPGHARLVERLGLDELWVAEDCFRHGGLTAAATALAVTETIRVGTGLLPAAVRNSAIAAMEIGTLAQLYPGRVAVGFGHGVEWWMRQIDARPGNRISALEEVVVAVRSLLHGDTVSIRGLFVHLDDVTLEPPPGTPPPVYIGTTGKLGVAIARSKADGLILAEGTGEAALHSLGGGVANVTVYSWLRVEEDGDAARESLVPTLASWREFGLFPNLFALAGVGPEQTIDRDAVDRMAIAGTPLDCARKLMQLRKAGATSVVVVPTGDDFVSQLERLAQEVVPVLDAATLV